MAAVLAGVGGAAVAAALLRRRQATPAPQAPAAEREPATDPRADELRRKLAQAREGAADEEDFAAAGMGAETIVEDDVDDLRRRVHEEARAAADEMRRAGGPEEA